MGFRGLLRDEASSKGKMLLLWDLSRYRAKASRAEGMTMSARKCFWGKCTRLLHFPFTAGLVSQVMLSPKFHIGKGTKAECSILTPPVEGGG